MLPLARERAFAARMGGAGEEPNGRGRGAGRPGCKRRSMTRKVAKSVSNVARKISAPALFLLRMRRSETVGRGSEGVGKGVGRRWKAVEGAVEQLSTALRVTRKLDFVPDFRRFPRVSGHHLREVLKQDASCQPGFFSHRGEGEYMGILPAARCRGKWHPIAGVLLQGETSSKSRAEIAGALMGSIGRFLTRMRYTAGSFRTGSSNRMRSI